MKAGFPPAFLALVLLALTAGILAARRMKSLSFLFRWLPVPFYCYFLPTCLAAAGLLPAESPLYGWAARFLLPVCLALLLINVDLPALAGLGRPALVAMAWGVGGMVGGMVAAYGFFHRWLPPEAWKSVGALAGSWTGGSANLIAVKEALGAPENVFSPVIVVDTVFAYSWMAFLIWLAGRQEILDRWNRVPTEGLVLKKVEADAGSGRGRPWPWAGVPVTALALAALSMIFGTTVGPSLSQEVGRWFPSLGNSLKPATWTVIAVTTAGLGAAFSGRFRVAPERTERIGNFILFFLLTILGSQASFKALGEAPAFLAVGAVALAVHGVFLSVGARVSRLPLSLLATASQACVGGVVSAPMVGAVYQPALAAVGLLLAIFGNVVGTYLGLLTAQLCVGLGK
jgi:uncharacterized membrane protein